MLFVKKVAQFFVIAISYIAHVLSIRFLFGKMFEVFSYPSRRCFCRCHLLWVVEILVDFSGVELGAKAAFEDLGVGVLIVSPAVLDVVQLLYQFILMFVVD